MVKSKVFFLICIYTLSLDNKLFSDIINTSSFNNEYIEENYIKSEPPRNYSYYSAELSPNNNFTAINEYDQRVIIIDNNNKIIFRFEWNDEMKNFPKSDAIHVLGWSNNDTFWFLTYIPAEIGYIAEVDIINKKLILY
jgi:hypothetical protein